MARRAGERIPQALFLKSATKPSEFPDPQGRPEIAIAGRSNVGKSSLINRFLNQKQLARVSGTPGRTQLLNFFLVDERYTLCDLPGYGYAKVPLAVKNKWGGMIESYLAERESLRALLLLLDCRRTPGEWEHQLISFCSYYGRAVVPVLTKVDKLSRSHRKPTAERIAKALGLSSKNLILWSAQSGEGLGDLQRRINSEVRHGILAEHTETHSQGDQRP
ncbi:MAG: ribosome biogenesis GTP-binding protein YihA/YsxC [Myxococcota bacterium]|nr:ribosome biogenesis GTP-binding protein YihA/YsxC [Myxococcota bacterium]